MRTLILTPLLVWGSAAFAQSTLDIQLNDAAQQYGLTTDGVQADMEAAIDDALGAFDQEPTLQAMTKAAGIAGKGMGVDYATNPKKFVVGVSAGTGVQSQNLSLSRGDELVPEGGFAMQLSLMAAVNLGILKGGKPGFWDHFVLSVHGLSYTGPSREIRGSTQNYGAHLQIKPIMPMKLTGLVEWGVVDLTAGYEYSRYSLGLTQDLPIAYDPVSWDASGNYDLTVTTRDIPIELSTNLRVSVVTVFLGAGFDIRTGEALSVASLGGDLTASANGETADIGSATLGLNYSSATRTTPVRFFVGPQINVLFGKLYGQLNVDTEGALGLHLGARIAL